MPPSPYCETHYSDYEKFQSCLNVVGPIACNVEYLEKFMQCTISNYVPKAMPSHRLRIAIVSQLQEITTDARIIEVMQLLPQILSSVADCSFVEMTLPLEDVFKANYELGRGIGYTMSIIEENDPTNFLPNEAATQEALDMVHTVNKQIDQEVYAKGFDCWMLPVTACPAFKHNKKHEPIQYEIKGSTELVPVPYWNALKYCKLMTTLGCPIVVAPCAMINDIPCGVQIIGRPKHDEELLAIAKVLEPCMPKFKPSI